LVSLNNCVYRRPNFSAGASERIGISRCLVPRENAAVEESPVKFIDGCNGFD